MIPDFIKLKQLLDDMCVLTRQEGKWRIIGPFFAVEHEQLAECVEQGWKQL